MNRKEKILGFTLAEVLVTMVIIVLMTLASIPVIKNSKMNRELGLDKNSWAAMYKSDANGTEQLVVIKDGTEYTYSGGSDDNFVDADTAKFIPPQGVTRLNVTVIGGGGGGAAGESKKGESRIFYPETVEKEHTFTPTEDGMYRIVAVGGGGGGGGSEWSCGKGSHGYSGGAVVATAKLRKDEVYFVVPGLGADRGKGKTFGASLLGAVIGWPAGLITTVATLGSFNISDMVQALTPKRPEDGGGHGMSSGFISSSKDVIIEAKGGKGGLFKRIKWFSCKLKSRNDSGYESSHKMQYSGANIISKTACPPHESGYLCTNGSCDNCKALENTVEGGVSTYWTFGNGGVGGSNGHGGQPGHAGFVQVSAVPVYGGGGGQAGTVSFYSFDTPPISKNSSDTYIPVYIGKGGNGGTPNTTLNQQKGADGHFSRFGTRIVAAGGLGGEIKRIQGEKNGNEYKALGENGGKTSVGPSLLKQAKLSETLQDVLLGGYEGANSTQQDGQSHTKFNAVPGSGGGGGGAISNAATYANSAGKGGNGATGIVLVTW